MILFFFNFQFFLWICSAICLMPSLKPFSSSRAPSFIAFRYGSVMRSRNAASSSKNKCMDFQLWNQYFESFALVALIVYFFFPSSRGLEDLKEKKTERNLGSSLVPRTFLGTECAPSFISDTIRQHKALFWNWWYWYHTRQNKKLVGKNESFWRIHKALERFFFSFSLLY